jgi:hypothetical protein
LAFADLAKKHATFIAGHALSETVGYQYLGSGVWLTVAAQVNRAPVDPVGEVLRNVVTVFVSKADVAEPQKGRDRVRLSEGVEPGESPPVFTVAQANETAGGWLLECNRK